MENMEQTTYEVRQEFIDLSAVMLFASMVITNGGVMMSHHASLAWKWAKILADTKPSQDGTIAKAVDVIRAQMKVDSELAWTWHCNIAMAFKDEGGSHKQANEAAARFMLSVFEVDVRLSDQWKQMFPMINTDSQS